MNEDEVRELQTQLRLLHHRQRREAPTFDGVSSSAVRVLGTVARGPASGMQPGEISTELGMTTSNVAAALRELDGGGWVRRLRDDQDGRRVTVTLTPAGATTVAQRRALRASWLHTAIDATLTPEEQATLRAAGALLGRVARYQR